MRIRKTSARKISARISAWILGLFAAVAATAALVAGCSAKGATHDSDNTPAHETGEYCFGTSYSDHDASGRPKNEFVFHNVNGRCLLASVS